MNRIQSDRTILHCDMNAFFASVELLDYPELKNVPMAVCGNPKNRHGIILAKNEIAKKYGIITAETLWQAKKKCPTLQCVPPHMSKYHLYSKQINDIYFRFTDLVEPFSIDESWLDVTGSQRLFGTGEEIATQIHEVIRAELGLTLSIGVSFNKIFAKMGSEYKKPDATTLISPTNFKTLLWPLSIEEMFFVGKSTSEKLRKSGISTIGDLANASVSWLQSLLGKQGTVLHGYANGHDLSPVLPASKLERMKSIGHSLTFSRDLVNQNDIATAMIALADQVSARLRKEHLLAGGMRLEIKDSTFCSISRQQLFPAPVSNAQDLAEMGISILRREWNVDKPIRLLQLTAIHLTPPDSEEQLSLFSQRDQGREKAEKVGMALDDIREKFGTQSIVFGRVLHNDIGFKGNPSDHQKKEKD